MSSDFHHWLYLLLDLLTLAGPLARSFEPRVQFSARWFALFPALATTGVGFVIWDVLFTKAGVWGFNSHYLLGPHLLGLPIEEWLFFVVVPYACVFMYDCLNYFFPMKGNTNWATAAAALLGFLALAIAVSFRDRLYTSVTCGLSAACMAAACYQRPKYLPAFLRVYTLSLVPFFLVNGVLTGAFTAEPIVWYDNGENMGVRLGTIPLEDAFYLLPLLWLVIVQYEQRLGRRLRTLTRI